MSAIVWATLLLLLGGAVFGMVAHICARLEERKYKKLTGGSLFYHRGKVPPLCAGAYRAVELKLCSDPCESALIIVGKRLLKSEAPALPLGGCKHRKCVCRYIQYDDRRFEQRRDVTLYGAPKGGTRIEGERRKMGAGRRAADKTGSARRRN